ncbi:MAG: GNAT family N-acetyltransferase [Candidatus Methylacidiphilales bacterium]|nr:GNAT family N-acetyltransferase [Candidatus Methylacidiphilales bacterium]
MKLEKVTTENVGQAIAAAREIFPYEIHADGFWPENAYRDSIRKGHPNFAYYLAKMDGDVVGITGHYPPGSLGREIWVGWFGIRPAHRHQGHGTALLAQTCRMLEVLGQRKIRLYSGDREEERPAQRLYVRAGFHVVGRGSVDGKPVLFFCRNPRANRVVMPGSSGNRLESRGFRARLKDWLRDPVWRTHLGQQEAGGMSWQSWMQWEWEWKWCWPAREHFWHDGGHENFHLGIGVMAYRRADNYQARLASGLPGTPENPSKTSA